MKKLFCLLIPILGLLSCSNELQETLHMAIAMSNESISFPTTEKTKIETDISNYITKIKPGNTSTFSKASNNYSLTPYIYKGDTIMYIANYTSGWELYSADQRTPLIMASSETGSFDMNDNNNDSRIQIIPQQRSGRVVSNKANGYKPRETGRLGKRYLYKTTR